MFKKFISLTSILCLILVLSSCSKNEATSSSEVDSNTTETTTSSTTIITDTTTVETTNEETTSSTTSLTTTTEASVAKASVDVTTATTKVPTTTTVTTPKVTMSPVTTTVPVTTTTLPVTTTVPTSESEYTSKVIELVNHIRTENGLSKFSAPTDLLNAANRRATEVGTSFSHTRPDGTSCFTVLSEFNITYRTCGENIAQYYQSPEEVVDGWMNSSGHRANILNSSFTSIGVGYDSATKSWVQLFLG